MPSSAMKPTEAGTDRYSRAIHSASTPPTSANGTLASTSSACRTLPKVLNRTRKMRPERQRHDQCEPRSGTLLVLELPAPGDSITGRQLHFGRHARLRLVHVTYQVTS